MKYVPRNYSIEILNEVYEDLESISKESISAAAEIIAFLEAIESDMHGWQDILDSFSLNGYENKDEPQFSVKAWEGAKKKNLNLWRLKMLNSSRMYRVIYAFYAQIKTYYILGVTHRDFDYNLNNLFSKRIIDSYDKLCIPKY